MCLVGYTAGKRFSSLVTGRTHQPAQLQQAGRSRIAPAPQSLGASHASRARGKCIFEPVTFWLIRKQAFESSGAGLWLILESAAK